MLQIDEYQELVKRPRSGCALIKASDPIEPEVVTCVCRFNENGDDCDSIGSLLASVGSLQKAYRGDSRTSVLDMAEEWERLADQQERATDLRQGKPSR